jgi:isoquinoline 1-oxidoreductase subunit beta
MNGPLRRDVHDFSAFAIRPRADTWKVDPKSCRAEKGEVIHSASGRRRGYGARLTSGGAGRVEAA